MSISHCPHTTPPPEGMHDAHDGTLDPRTSIVLAHGPVLDPRFRISIRAAPRSAALHPGTIRHPGSRSTSLHSGTARHTSLHRAPLYAAPLCTAPLLHLSMHLSAPLRRAAHLRMRSAARCARRSACCAKCWIDALTRLPASAWSACLSASSLIRCAGRVRLQHGRVAVERASSKGRETWLR